MVVAADCRLKCVGAVAAVFDLRAVCEREFVPPAWNLVTTVEMFDGVPCSRLRRRSFRFPPSAVLLRSLHGAVCPVVAYVVGLSPTSNGASPWKNDTALSWGTHCKDMG